MQYSLARSESKICLPFFSHNQKFKHVLPRHLGFRYQSPQTVELNNFIYSQFQLTAPNLRIATLRDANQCDSFFSFTKPISLIL